LAFTSLQLPSFPLLADFGRDEEAFKAYVEQDATTFKPMGEKMYSYTRRSPAAKDKGKGVISAVDLDPESEDTLVFEVYHVRPCLRSVFNR